MKRLSKDEKDTVNLDLLDRKEWLEFCKHLWYIEEDDNGGEHSTGATLCLDFENIEYEEFEEVLKNSSNMKAENVDNIDSELYN